MFTRYFQDVYLKFTFFKKNFTAIFKTKKKKFLEHVEWNVLKTYPTVIYFEGFELWTSFMNDSKAFSNFGSDNKTTVILLHKKFQENSLCKIKWIV